MSHNRLTQGDIDQLASLTEDNEHELALWFTAHQLGLDQVEHEAATHMCHYLIAGELTPVLEFKSRRIRNRLHAAMNEVELAAFRSAT